MKNTALSLFSGAGGMDVGIDKAGFRTICAVDSDPHCAATLHHNATRRKTVWQTDIRVLDPSSVMKVLGIKAGELSLLYGGPPCQPFSQIGKQGGLADPRGGLVFELVRFASYLHPTAVIIEQVPYFLRAKAGKDDLLVQVLKRDFERIGYDVHIDTLDASDYGVPQRRQRVIIVCVPAGQSFSFPLWTRNRQKTVGQALEGLPPPTKLGAPPRIANHIDVTPERDKERISYVPEGLWLSKSPDVPPEIMRNLTRKDTTKYRRLSRNELAPTLRCGEAPYHPIENRYITPRESARIQGFSDKHEFVGPIRRRTGTVRNLDQHRQVANAVPPPLARAVAQNVKDCLCLQ